MDRLRSRTLPLSILTVECLLWVSSCHDKTQPRCRLSARSGYEGPIGATGVNQAARTTQALRITRVSASDVTRIRPWSSNGPSASCASLATSSISSR